VRYHDFFLEGFGHKSDDLGQEIRFGAMICLFLRSGRVEVGEKHKIIGMLSGGLAQFWTRGRKSKKIEGGALRRLPQLFKT